MKIKVWDLPVRICHWMFFILISFQFISVEFLNNEMLANPTQWHFYSGYICLAVVIFRLNWGLFGTHYAKFRQFVVSPAKAFRYLRSNSLHDYIGHNPAGAYSVIALLCLILAQALTGLFMSDDIFNDAPYYGVLGDFWQNIFNFIHHKFAYVLLGFIVLHIGAIVFYKLKYKQSLTKAMITGHKIVKQTHTTQGRFPWIGFLISLIVTALAMYFILEVLPPAPVDDYFIY